MCGYVYSNRFVNVKKITKILNNYFCNENKKSLKIYIETKKSTTNRETKEDIKKCINDILGILTVELHEDNNKQENKKINNSTPRQLYLFFDVDGTLTEKDVKHLVPQTLELFQKLHDDGCHVFLVGEQFMM